MQNVRGWNLPSFNWAELQDRFCRWAQVWQVQQSIYRCCQDAIGEATQSQESDLACEELWMKVVNILIMTFQEFCFHVMIWFGQETFVFTMATCSWHCTRCMVVGSMLWILVPSSTKKHLRLAISQMQLDFRTVLGNVRLISRCSQRRWTSRSNQGVLCSMNNPSSRLHWKSSRQLYTNMS